jgi:hypothetical protein
MIADSNSDIAWHRVRLRKNREALRALEIARFHNGQISGSAAAHAMRRVIGSLKRKISESERCIATHDKRTRRPLATDLRSLAQVEWNAWNAAALAQPIRARVYHS